MLSLTEIRTILYKMGLRTENLAVSAEPFICAEDGEEYSVLALNIGGNKLVLKEAKQFEIAIYSEILTRVDCHVPRLYATANHWGKDYILMEYVSGEPMMNCSRSALISALDALIYLQRSFWQNEECSASGYTFDKSLESRIERGKHLADSDLERAYSIYLKKYSNLPRTLCHDDLLPFNVLISSENATIIDWEIAGILPYPSSLARLIAHCEDDEKAFFRISNQDRDFAVWYYYDRLLKPMNISYDDFSSALNACLFYEYCEWIMLGNKYGGRGSQRFKHYYKKAKALSAKII